MIKRTGIAAVVLAVATLTACGGTAPSSQSTPGSGATAKSGCPDTADGSFVRPKVEPSGTIRVAVEESFTDYNNNTAAANNFANTRVLANVQPSPFFSDDKLRVCMDGDVMESVKVVNTSPQTVEYRINAEATWSDGAPLSCKDFYLAWLAATARKGDVQPFEPAGTSGYALMQAPKCSDGGKTVTTVFDAPYADWRSLFSSLVPAHVVEKESGVADITTLRQEVGPAEEKVAAAYLKAGAGFDPALSLSAGPYLIESTNDELTVLVRNPKWWGNTPGPQRLELTLINEGQAEVQALQNAEVHVISPQPDSALAEQLRTSDGVVFNAYPGLTFEHLDFNMGLPLFQGDAGAALRKATAQCIDRTEIIEKLVAGVNPKTEPLGNLFFQPGEKDYVDHYADYRTADVAAAKATMEAAGWKLGSDGVYAMGDRKAAFTLGHKVIDNRQRISQLVSSMCAKAGIKITDFQDAAFNAEMLPASNFEMALFAWVGTPYKTSAVPNYTTDGGANYNKYSNKEFDELTATAESTLDAEALTTLLNKADEVMAADLHTIPLYQFSDMVAHSEDITPVLTYNGSFGGQFWNAFEWVHKP